MGRGGGASVFLWYLAPISVIFTLLGAVAVTRQKADLDIARTSLHHLHPSLGNFNFGANDVTGGFPAGHQCQDWSLHESCPPLEILGNLGAWEFRC